MSLSIDYILKSITATSAQVVILLGPVLLLAIAMQIAAEFVERFAYRLLGHKVYLWMFAWLGTAVHELGHAFFCVIFRHRIIDMQLFSLDPTTGTLGYVHSEFDRHNAFHVVGNFFIGIGPILFGSALIFFLHGALVSYGTQGQLSSITINFETIGLWSGLLVFMQESISSAAFQLTNILTMDNLTNWKFYLFLYFAFSIGSSITLSLSDIRGALSGFGALIVILLVLNVLTLWTGFLLTNVAIYLSQFLELVYAVMILTLALNIVFGVLLLIITYLLRWRTGY